MDKGNRKRCAILNCPYSFKTPVNNSIRFFRFPNPKQELRMTQWKLACGREDILEMDPSILYENYRICSTHFNPTLTKDRKLDSNAIPLLNLFQESNIQEEHNYSIIGAMEVAHYVEIETPNKEYRSCELQTDNILYNQANNQTNVGTQTTSFKTMCHVETQTSALLSFNSPRKEKLRKKLKEEQENCKELRREIGILHGNIDKLNNSESGEREISISDFKVACDKFLPSFFSDITKHVADMKDKSPKARRYPRKLKQHALSIYYTSPSTYRRMIEKYNFPSIRTLRRMVENLHHSPGINDFVFRSLQLRLRGKSEQDKMCVLTMDEVSLKANLQYDMKKDEIIGFHDIGHGKEFKPAKNALVLMARGINVKWKQPLGFFFVHTSCKAEDLMTIVTDCITKMADIGLDVRALISDMGSNFIQLSKNWDVTVDNTSFQVNGRKLYYIFDTPHLLKSLRNTLLKYTIEFEGKEAAWTFIEALYEFEKHRDLKMATKLTDAHIYPTNFQKMKVKYAAQVFSATVVSAMSTYMAHGHLDASAMGTINMLEKFDHVFDILNSSTINTKNQFKKPYTGTEAQTNFLQSIIQSLKSMKVLKTTNTGKENITSRFKTITCFQITIKSIMDLSADLKECGIEKLRTRRLNQDCLENFFGKIRQQGGNSVNPTPTQFISAFKKLSCLDLLDCTDTFNCAADIDDLLLNEIPPEINIHIEQEQTPHNKCSFKVSRH